MHSNQEVKEKQFPELLKDFKDLFTKFKLIKANFRNYSHNPVAHRNMELLEKMIQSLGELEEQFQKYSSSTSDGSVTSLLKTGINLLEILNNYFNKVYNNLLKSIGGYGNQIEKLDRNLMPNALSIFAKEYLLLLEKDKANENENYLEEFADAIDALLDTTMDIRLQHLYLWDLDAEIKQLEERDVTNRDEYEYKQKLTEDLKKLREILCEDINDQRSQQGKSFKDIAASPAITQASEIASLIHGMTFNIANQEAELEKIETYRNRVQTRIQAEPRFKNFAKAVGAVLLSLGTMILGAVKSRSVEGIKAGIDVAKRTTSIPQRDSLSSYLLFKPTTLNQSGLNISEDIKNLIKPPEAKR